MRIRRRVITVATVLTLAGCGARPDNSICTAIIDPPSPKDATESLALQGDAAWQVKRADACVHRQAYRLARSSDPATIVAKAVVEACRSPISAVGPLISLDERDVGVNPPRWVVDSRLREVDGLYEQRALSKVVEGRAGNCRG